MTNRFDPLHRERQAHLEIGETAVAPRLAGALVVALVTLITVVPGIELTRSGSLESWLGLLRPGGSASVAGGEGGWLSANRRLLAAMSEFEDRLEEESMVGAAVRPWAQWVQTAALGVGHDRTLVGEDGWLFFRPSVSYVTGPGFLAPDQLARRELGGSSWEPPPAPDPMPALLALERDLAARGIDLVVLPVPVKASIHPERLVAAAGAAREPVQNASWGELLARLSAAGVRVVDPGPALWRAAREGHAQFLARDTHWSPAAVERTAELVAERVVAESLVPPEPLADYRGRPEEVEGIGDLQRILELPAAAPIFPPQTVKVRRVERARNAGWSPWAPEPSADVLLVGDSFTNVYSQPDVGWGEGAGLAEQLTLALGRPVDRLAVNAGGADAARRRLYDLLATGGSRIQAKKLVVYQMSARELAIGDWKLFAFAAGGPVRSSVDPADDPSLPTPPRPAAGEPPASGAPPEERPPPAADLSPPLGEGFVVWESNRTGDWRLWSRRLDGTGLRQITPDEPGLQHCCPHLSPDGRRLVYLARSNGRDRYPEEEIPGPLRLIELGPDGEPVARRELVARARTYGWGNRAAVWRGDDEIVYVAADGRTMQLDLIRGDGRALTDEPRDELGWLVDPTLRWASHAAPTFSRYDAAGRRVLPRGELGGCEPYFTQDGRWGYYIAAGGGPINRIDLATRETSTVVRKNDPRLPAGAGYLYFPMVSRDGSLLAWGASGGEHDHFRSDYNIWVAPVDPQSLELAGAPVRLTDDPRTDRYPDVHLRPLPLGRHAGEAPLTVRFPPLAGVRLWRFGDGATSPGGVGEHRYDTPGVYEVVAETSGGTRSGRVVVHPARPPRAVDVELRSAATRIGVGFDEPVRLSDGARAGLGSGVEIEQMRVEPGGRRLVLHLARPLAAADRLRLEGIVDRAQRPNRMPAVELEVPAPSWPATRSGLVFLWQTAEADNALFDPELRTDVVDALTARGRARLDGRGRMVLGSGWFEAPAAAGERVLAAASRANEVTLEATLVPGPPIGDELRRIVTFSPGPKRRNLTLGQRGERLVARVRTGPSGPNADRPEVPLFAVEAGQPVHVTVTYSPGLLVAYRNGEKVAESRQVVSGLNRWQPFPLSFGAEPGGAGDWSGTLEGVAMYARVLSADEVRESYQRYRQLFLARPPGPARHSVQATLVAKSRVPTLREISPYRRALAVFDYRVDEVQGGTGLAAGDRVRVAHWVLLDGERTPASNLRVGAAARLQLEPFAANPQLEAHYLADTLEPPRSGSTLYFAAGD